MKFTAGLVISLTVLLKSLSVRSCYPPKYSDSRNTRCSISNDVDGTEQDLENKTTWTVIDDIEGTVLIQFPFLNSSVGRGYTKCPTKYELTLKVKDGQDFLQHSKHNVWVTGQQNSFFCDKMANVTFTHMFTGTYELRIKVGCSCLIDDKILIKNITTSYKKRKFTADSAVGFITPQHQLRQMKFEISVDTNMKYILKYTNSCRQVCKESSYSKPTCQWKVRQVQRTYNDCIVDGCSLIKGVENICYWSVGYPWRNDTETTFCEGKVKGEYSVEEEVYDITVLNVSTGCYCITAQKLDSRVEDKVWGNLCQKAHSPFVYVNPVITDGKSPVLYTTVPISLIAVMCGVVLFVPVIMWRLWKFLRRRVPANEKPGIPNSNNLKRIIVDCHKAEILLLYPRDCEPFMKVMKQFKELLKTTCKCEVLDYYDQEHSAEIDREGNSWLLKKINSPTTKIILVESVCSVLCQQAHFGGIIIKPAIQQSRDNFFTLALVELTSNKHKVFVIRFNNNLAEEASLKFISRGVRYVMPNQLRKLITAMGFYISEDVVQIDKDMETMLTNNINGFINYANDNKNYVIDLYKKC